MSEQMFEKGVDIQAREISGSKLKIESQTFPFRRYGQSIDGGNTILFVKMVKKGRLPFRRPSPSNVRNEQKARLIKEDQMGPTSVGVFLYGANGTASNERSVPRFFVRLAALASDSSSPGLLGVSTHGWGDIERRTVGRSLWLPGLRSINQSDTRQIEDPLKVPGQAGLFDLGSAWGAGLGLVGALVLEPLSLGRPEATGTLNSLKHSKRVRWPADSCPPSTNGWPPGAAFPAVLELHGVSCPILYED
jgi:hypothetical protein